MKWTESLALPSKFGIKTSGLWNFILCCSSHSRGIQKSESKKIKISDAIRHHYEQRERSIGNKKALSAERHFFKKFYEFLFGRRKDFLHEIQLSELLDFRSRLRNDEGQAASSVNRIMASINGVLNRAETLDWIETSPAKKLKKRPEAQARDYDEICLSSG